VKDRWVFPLRRDSGRSEPLRVNDAGAIRYWQARATPLELRLALQSPSPEMAAAAREIVAQRESA
jgi:hypothetical protein